MTWAGAAVLGLGLATTGCGHTRGAEAPMDRRAQARALLAQNKPEQALALLESRGGTGP
jgi:hypothetical protein